MNDCQDGPRVCGDDDEEGEDDGDEDEEDATGETGGGLGGGVGEGTQAQRESSRQLRKRGRIGISIHHRHIHFMPVTTKHFFSSTVVMWLSTFRKPASLRISSTSPGSYAMNRPELPTPGIHDE